MIAWVSPSRMVRSTPLRISLGPSSVSTLTRRSLISSVAMSVVSHWCVQVDEYVVAVDADGIDGYGFGGRRAGRLAGAEVEARSVHPALDRAAVHVALGERDRGVRALVLDREDVVALAYQGQVEAVELDAQGCALVELRERAGALEGHSGSPRKRERSERFRGVVLIRPQPSRHRPSWRARPRRCRSGSARSPVRRSAG